MTTRVLLIGGTGNNLFQLSYALSKTKRQEDVVFLRPTPVFVRLQKALLRADVRSPDLALRYLADKGYAIEDIRSRDLLRLGAAFLRRKIRQLVQKGRPDGAAKDDFFVDDRTLVAGYFQVPPRADLKHLKPLAEDMISHLSSSASGVDQSSEGRLVVHFRGGDNKDSSWEALCKSVNRIVCDRNISSINEVVFVSRYIDKEKLNIESLEIPKNVSLRFLQGNSEEDDLLIFSMSSYLLVDVSSFSYFGALGNKEGKIFTPCALSNYPFLAPDTWEAAQNDVWAMGA